MSNRLPLSVQLYTVRDQQKTDFAGTVKQIASFGYQAVELAGYGNLAGAKEVRKALDDVGLKVSGSHAGIDALEGDLEKVLADQEILGNKIVICPWLPEARRKDAGTWKEFAGSLNRIGQACAKRGFDFAYHNHSFEFVKLDGVYAMDILLQNTDPKFVRTELDVYWLKHGGLDPVSYINQLGSRTILLHIKDMAPGEERRFAEVGAGILDFKAIAAAGQNAGVKWYVVEQDNCYGKNPIDCVKTSSENLKKMGLA
jgi:sugar phosphate isomerase/epimerase